MKRNIKLVIEYDGTAYNGWQRQADVLTIQQVMEDTLARIVNERVVLVASSRTDTGVHALNQVANFRTSSGLPLRNLHLGGQQPCSRPTIAVKRSARCPGSSTRSTCLGKVYRTGSSTTPCGRRSNGPVLARAQAP